MTLPLLLASALAVTAPDGAAVCRVTPPDLGADAPEQRTRLAEMTKMLDDRYGFNR